MKTLRRLAVGGLLAGTVVLFAGCSDDDPVGPTTGTLEVLLLMDGTDIDANGGQVVIDGTSRGAIFEDIERSIEELEQGVYVLELRGIAENCAILGNNPRNVRIRGGEVSSERFQFLCEPVSGKDPGDDRPEA